MMQSALRVKGLVKRYGTLTAVDDVTFDLASGDILALLGASGCGKTTTLRLIAGLETPDDGDIWLADRHVSGKGDWVQPEDRRVGMVFQDYALFPHLSVSANIAFGLKHYRGEKTARVTEMLRVVGLDGLQKRMPHQLSGGQQQRVALARALAPQPNILLLDEPFSNLDAALRAQVRGEIRAILREAKVTSIFVTHDQEEALSLADKVAVMRDGHVSQFGTPHQIYTQPVSREVAQFVGEANFIPAQADGMTAKCVLGDVTLVESAHGAVAILVRPEAFYISSDGVSARVLWSEFYGHDQRVGVILTDGTRLIIRTDSYEVYTPDSQIGVAINRAVYAYPA
ncbi:MAG: ABC transporter ATP-binding protein [Phototrophicales bacterium]|mgnify:CR=1 FL=1|nr:ABC transporter ATP-binding protein [Phototrophicales bacterium]